MKTEKNKAVAATKIFCEKTSLIDNSTSEKTIAGPTDGRYRWRLMELNRYTTSYLVKLVRLWGKNVRNPHPNPKKNIFLFLVVMRANGTRRAVI